MVPFSLITAVGLALAPCGSSLTPAALDARLDKLLALYRKYELPLPPAGAPLVRYQRGGGGEVYVNGKRQPPQFGLAFLVTPAKKNSLPRLFVGLYESESLAPEGSIQVVEPAPASIPAGTVYGGVDLAVQCRARGWTALARDALRRTLIGNYPTCPEQLLADDAWPYWTRELTIAGTDRARIARQLKAVLAARSKPAEEHERALIKSLELALAPSKAKPGTIEAEIDALMEIPCETPGLGPSIFGSLLPDDPRLIRLVQRGFDAVPALIAHLDDERITRLMSPGFNNFRSWHYRVGDLVGLLLQSMAGEDLGTSDFDELKGYRVKKADAEKWWKQARQVGEEAYFTRHVLTDDREAAEPNELMLGILAKKYPNRLPEVYRKLLSDRPRMASRSVVEALTASSVPRETKRALFLEGYRRKNPTQRIDALSGLRVVDPELCDRLLIDLLASVPKQPAPESGWDESGVQYLVAETANPAVWKALTDAAKQAAPPLRAKLVSICTSPGPKPAVRKAMLAYLAGFLDDQEVDGVVAEQIGLIVKLKTQRDRSWTGADWAKFLAEVRQALERERGR